ncbi:MAG: type II secretion system F family protein [Planctomycetota bacterium]|nr:MAG: type II secretion system F family protein [Planctomycetota bacterium]
MMTPAPSSIPFLYVAVKPQGGKRVGLRYARDESELAGALADSRLLLLRARRLPTWTGRAQTLTLKDQAALNEQLAALVGRGVPLVEALEVAESVVTPRAAPVVARLRERVSAGDSFADACRRSGAFDPVVATVYRSAEQSGALADATRRLARSARDRLAIASKVLTMMIYPAVVLAVGLIVTAVVLTQVVPRVAQTLRSAGGTLPWYTEAVLRFGEGLRDHGLTVAIVAGVVAVAALVLRRAVMGLAAGLARRAPIVGPVLLASDSARFFSIMAAMTRAGVPLADALSVATGAVAHPRLRAQLEDLGRGLVEGGVLADLIDRLDALPLATRRLLIAADRAGDLDSAFEGLAADLAADVDTKAQRAVGLLEPMLIVGVFIVIGGTLFSVMLPLVTMGSRIGGGV